MHAERPYRKLKTRFLQSRHRRGVAVVLVLGLLAITLAISYATLRSQGTTTQLARNNSRGLEAREAARSGLAAALRKISEDGWAGIGVPLTANVTGNSWYEVSFTTGDAKLTPADPKYDEYPFRVTIDAAGYASDPINPTVRAMHKSRCVVQLLRRALAPEPANWSALTNLTLCQWGNSNVLVQFPVRVSGRTVILGKVYLALEYPQTGAALHQYLSDLNAMRLAGEPDYRPFASPLVIALARQDAATLDLLTAKLGLVTVDTLASTSNPLAHPGPVSDYRLYPGGQSYTIPVLQSQYGSTLQNITLGPDPLSNPLGVFRSNGTLSVQNNVRITGTVITDGAQPDIRIYGTNVVVQAANLPKLNGSNDTHQLPVALVRDDLRAYSSSESQIRGFAMVWDEFELDRGSSSTRFSFQGTLAASGLELRGREPWTLDSTQWANELTAFNAQLSDALNPNRVLFFPRWMQLRRGFTVQPALTLEARSSGVQPHWQDWSRPIYEKGSTDVGLKWEVVRWEEGT